MDWDIAVLVVACIVSAFVGGYDYGVHANPGYKCPQVANEKVVSSSSSPDGEMCMYVKDRPYGHALNRRKI